MTKKPYLKVRLVPESKPNSPYFYYVKKPSAGEKAKIKLKVKISSFGTFQKRRKNERVGRNPKTKEKKIISARKVITFKASKLFKDRINQKS